MRLPWLPNSLRAPLNRISTDLRRQVALARLRRLKQQAAREPKRTPGKISIFGWSIEYADASAVEEMLRLQVLDGYNDFICDNPAPRILDCGANIGVSVLRYKQLFPNAEIVAFEPDPKLNTLLRRNLVTNGAGDVEVVEAAVWSEANSISFICEGTLGGHIASEENEIDSTVKGRHSIVTVPTVPLKEYLERPVDLIKMDIEGAELAVLRSCRDNMDQVSSLIVEVHHLVERADVLSEILMILYTAGFHVAVNSNVWLDLRTSHHRQPERIADQWPVICAWRPRS